MNTPSNSSDNSQDLLDQAIAKHQAGDTKGAATLYEQLLQTKQKAHALHLLGVIAHQDGDHLKAIEQIEQALLVDPGLISGRFNLANIHLGLGDKNKAFQLFHECARLKPDYLEAHFQCGLLLGEHGEHAEAVDAFRKVLVLNPNHASAFLQKGVCETHLGQLSGAIETLQRACELDPHNADCFFGLANAYSHSGRHNDAEVLLDKSLQLSPNHYRAWNNKGVLFLDNESYDEAATCFRQALVIQPTFVEAHNNLGNVLRAQCKFKEAESAYRKSLECRPGYADAHYNLGVVLSDMDRFDEAVTCYEMAIQSNPNYWRAYVNLGAVLHRHFKQPLKAKSYFDRVIANDQQNYEAFFNLGNAVKDLGDPHEAMHYYKACLQIKPDYCDALNNLGLCQKDVGSYQDALESYLLAIKIKPDYARALNNLGVLYRLLDKPNEALTAYNQAIEIDPKFVDAYNNRGNLFKEFGRLDSAIADYEKVFALDSDYEFFFGTLQHARMKACDWRGFNDHIRHLKKSVQEGGRVSPPFPLLALFDDPELHARNTHNYADALYPPKVLSEPFTRPSNDGRIRLGYYSSDFYNHATSYLIAELFELHDRGKFYLIGFSWGPKLHDAMFNRVKNAFDEFYEVHEFGDLAIARLSRERGVDIAVDLKGYTSQCRTAIFSYRCAPIQINYLGYPGSMQALYFDFIVADRFLIPEESQVHYSEKVLYLPDTYQVNDRKRPIPRSIPCRTEVGLPEDAFVFCCFNNNYKITPSIFDLWCNILTQCPRSILWLFKDNELVVENLRREASIRKVDPNRLYFAERASLEDHLSRHLCADLMLDTFPYSAHTTASDSLWAGLPLLTLCGSSFASRVAASLLNASGLQQLVTYSEDDYLQLAVSLYHDPTTLKALSKRLLDGREHSVVFDVVSFVRHYESGLSNVYTPKRLQPLSEAGSRDSRSFVINPSEASVSHPPEGETEPQGLRNLLQIKDEVVVLDIGAALINEIPVYHKILSLPAGRAYLFDGDPRQTSILRETYGESVIIFDDFLFDGNEQTCFVCTSESGMTSLLEPDPAACKFFNGFEKFASVVNQRTVATRRLDSYDEIEGVDFLKLDAQGSELTILTNGCKKLSTVSILQIELPYVCLYKNQPTYSDIESFLRKQGFIPHHMVECKRWSIDPLVRDGNIRKPYNQLLEADVVFIRDPLSANIAPGQIKKLAFLAHLLYGSYDLTAHLVEQLNKCGAGDVCSVDEYLSWLARL